MSDRLREAAVAALEVLERLHGGCTDSDDGTVEALTVWCPEIIDNLRAALAEEQREIERLTAERDAAVREAASLRERLMKERDALLDRISTASIALANGARMRKALNREALEDRVTGALEILRGEQR